MSEAISARVVSRLLLAAGGLATAAVFFIKSLSYPSAAARMPIIYAVIVGGLAVLLAAQALWHAWCTGTAGERPAASGASRSGQIKLVGMVAITLAYVFLLFPAGYLIATLAFLGLSLLWLRHVSIAMAAIGTVMLVAVICIVFIWFLNLPIRLVPAALTG